MKMRSKKGFTIVELVIVIAVIAILAAVMIPTFSGMVNKAKESAAMQEANGAMTAVLVEEEEFDTEATYYFVANGYWFKLDGQKLVEVPENQIPAEIAYDAADEDADFLGDTVYAKTTTLPEDFDVVTGTFTPIALADLSSDVVVIVDREAPVAD